MTNKIVRTLILFLVIGGGNWFVSIVNAQTENVNPEIKAYVEQKGKKAKVPADINKLVKGDLNGDGETDVAIQYYIQVGYPGNLTATYLTVFVSKKGKMTFAAEELSEVVPAEIKNGEIVCDKYGSGGKKFEKVGTVKYKLAKKKLIEVKAEKQVSLNL